LPAEAIDTTVRGLAGHGFERRYGLRFEDPQIRFRWLDPSRAPVGISDAAIPLSQLAAYAPSCDHVIVTENKINFLTLPQSPKMLAIFGGGYAIDLVQALPWLVNQPLHYWGDLDTHGFAILSRLRRYFPHTRSFLMDRDTLVNHRKFWTEELSGTRVLRDLPTLDLYEQALYDDLRNDRLGDRVRLEQERVQYHRPPEPARVAGAGGSSTPKRVRPRQRNGFSSVATINMEIGIQREHETPIVNLGHSNEADVRQRRGDVVVAIKEFANRRSLLGQTHPKSQRPGFD
jgi:hypothetical protein